MAAAPSDTPMLPAIVISTLATCGDGAAQI